VAGIVLAAYSYVGYFIFGHQYSGMQSFSKSMSTLFFMMMNFDPSQFWLEMMAAGGPFALHVFMWTYNVITFFILLNMFLAIIVDSYASVKADTEDSQGLLSELANVSVATVVSEITVSPHRCHVPRLLQSHMSATSDTLCHIRNVA
jgi:hypothetical protein